MLAPTIVSTTPNDGAVEVALNGDVGVTFSEAMDCTTLTAKTFTLTAMATMAAVQGSVLCGGSKAVFTPTANLASDGAFEAAIATGAKSAGGVDLAKKYTWSFTTGATVAVGKPVNLGSAGDFAVLAKSAVSTVPTSAITGDVGVSPAAATFLTGFSLVADSTNVFATSPQVTGKLYAADYAPPTPSNLTTAIGDMGLAFTDAAGRAPDVTELGAGDIGGMTLPAGVYAWGTGLLIPTNLTLTGGANDVWIFQIAKDLKVSSAVEIVLQSGALSKNIFWQVSGLVDVGTTAHLEGIVLSQTAITLGTGASVNGRLLAQTAVNLDSNVIDQPAP